MQPHAGLRPLAGRCPRALRVTRHERRAIRHPQCPRYLQLMMRCRLIALALAAVCLCCNGCRSVSRGSNPVPPIVGTWLVKTPEAPFQYHMFTFHSDGTMLQSNPDAGDPSTSDSNGMGVWTQAAADIKGKFVEVTADRATRQFVSRGEISFLLHVKGDALSGTASATFYDSQDRKVSGPISATLEGRRVVPSEN